MKKDLDSSKINSLGWRAKNLLKNSIDLLIDDFNFRYKNEHKFYHFYYRAKVLNEYLILEEDCAKAMQLYDTLLEDNEMNLLKWLAENEYLKDELILFYPEFIDENTNRLQKVMVNLELNISISID
jgi:hypothetical protein